jgi:hypothetical protein
VPKGCAGPNALRRRSVTSSAWFSGRYQQSAFEKVRRPVDSSTVAEGRCATTTPTLPSGPPPPPAALLLLLLLLLLDDDDDELLEDDIFSF